MNYSNLKPGITLGCLLLSTAFSGASAHADYDVVVGANLQQKEFNVAPGTCGLKRFSLLTTRDRAKDGNEYNRDTSMAALLDVSDPSCLREYGVVQFIRGCSYEIYRNDAKGINSLDFTDYQSYGQDIPFVMPDWIVDTIDVDPLYDSYSDPDATPAKRMNWYSSPNHPITLEKNSTSLAAARTVFFNEYEKAKYYDFLENIPDGLRTQIFTTDMPGGGFYSPDMGGGTEVVDVSSLQFMTCVYHLKDIPMTGSPASFTTPENLGGPMQCFSWQSNVRFDQDKREFTYANTLDPVCTGSEAQQAILEAKQDAAKKAATTTAAVKP
jgi:hypothetical protein